MRLFLFWIILIIIPIIFILFVLIDTFSSDYTITTEFSFRGFNVVRYLYSEEDKDGYNYAYTLERQFLKIKKLNDPKHCRHDILFLTRVFFLEYTAKHLMDSPTVIFNYDKKQKELIVYHNIPESDIIAQKYKIHSIKIRYITLDKTNIKMNTVEPTTDSNEVFMK